MHKLILLGLMTATAVQAGIQGRVVDAETGEPLVGANVVVREHRAGSATNLDGFFRITTLEQGSYQLQASFQGYAPEEKAAVVTGDAADWVVFELQAEALRLDELVYIAREGDSELRNETVNTGRIRLKAARMASMPATLESDVVRSFQSMPGVLQASDYSSDLHVRGSAGDENLILLDGVEVYNPNHLGGVFSSFIPSTVKMADLQRSSFPAEFGGRTGSVLSVQSRQGNRKSLSADLRLGALSSSAMLAGPFSRGTWMLAARRTYLDLASRTMMEHEIPYYFLDLQGGLELDLSERDRLGLSVYDSGDVFDSGALDLKFGNRAATLRLRRILHSGLFVRGVASWTSYHADHVIGGEEGYTSRNRLEDWTGRIELESTGSRLDLLAGFSLKSLQTSLGQEFHGSSLRDVKQGMSESALYASLSWKPNDTWIVEPGLRAVAYGTEALQDASSSKDASAYIRMEPRLGVKYMLSERVRLKAAWGLYNQGLQKYSRDQDTNSFIWTALDSTAAPTHAIHWTGGIEADLPGDILLDLEGYYKRLGDVREGAAFQNREEAAGTTIRELFELGKARAFGVDLGLHRESGRWNGMLAYSLSWAIRDFDSLNGGRPYYAFFDTRHNLNTVLHREFHFDRLRGFPFSGGFRLFRFNSARFTVSGRYASGHRYTGSTQRRLIGGEGLDASERQLADFGARNTKQLRDYSRLDLSWSMLHKTAGREFECKVGVLNLLNAPNYWGVSLASSQDPANQRLVEKKDNGMSRMPSIELIWRFK